MKKTFFLILLVLVSGISFSQSSTALKKKKQALNREIEILKRSRSKIDKSKKISLEDIRLLNAQINLREEKIGTINSEVKILNYKIQDHAGEVQSLQGQLKSLKFEYAKMLQFAQRNKNSYDKLMFIFAARNFNQAFMRLKYLQQFTSYRKRQAGYIENTRTDLEVQITRLDKNKQEKGVLLHDQEAEKENLGRDKESKSQEVVKLTRQEQTLRKQLTGKQKQASSLNRAIKEAIRKEVLAAQRRAAEAARLAAAKAKAANATKTTDKPVAKGTSILASSPADAKLSSSFAGNRGRFPKPVSGVVVENFGSHKYGNVTVYNPGINIKTSPGAAV
ncbi:MAG: peptidase M23, partial [Flavobacterium sp.]|nr:peptidase M23 [Pedobacter sp.]